LSSPRITVATNNWDHLAPLVRGEVSVEGLDLHLDRFAALTPARDDRGVQACEQSLSQYLLYHAAGDRRWVGVPVFLMRTFRHRSFYVQRDSRLTRLPELRAKRVGISGWPDTGNTWARAALRAANVDIQDVTWWLGPVEDASYDARGHRPSVDLPPNVHQLADGQTLRQMLLEGELEAIVCPIDPRGVGEADAPIRHLLVDYEDAERDYGRTLGFCPAHHLLALRRAVFEQMPWIAQALYAAFNGSHQRWLADQLAGDRQPHGLRANAAMLRLLAAEQHAQGLSPRPIDSIAAFADFASVVET
jgi:4,5-dihydroxyphthalate decarboxylase